VLGGDSPPRPPLLDGLQQAAILPQQRHPLHEGRPGLASPDFLGRNRDSAEEPPLLDGLPFPAELPTGFPFRDSLACAVPQTGGAERAEAYLEKGVLPRGHRTAHESRLLLLGPAHALPLPEHPEGVLLSPFVKGDVGGLFDVEEIE